MKLTHPLDSWLETMLEAEPSASIVMVVFLGPPVRDPTTGTAVSPVAIGARSQHGVVYDPAAMRTLVRRALD